MKTTEPTPVGAKTESTLTNDAGKPLFPATLIMVACNQCDAARAWPLTCGHDYVRSYAHEYHSVNSLAALTVERDRLRLALVQAAIPYEAVLMDAESRRWIAPQVWSAIEAAVTEVRAALEEQK